MSVTGVVIRSVVKAFVCIVSKAPTPSRLSMLAVVAVPVQLVGRPAGSCLLVRSRQVYP